MFVGMTERFFAIVNNF